MQRAAYILNDVGIPVERAPRNGAGKRQNDRGIRKERQREARECSLGDGFARMLEISGHASSTGAAH